MNLIHDIGLLLTQRWLVLLGWTLVHFLWQGTLIAVAFAVTRVVAVRSSNSAASYLLACGSLGAMTLAPVVTYLALLRSDSAEPLRPLWSGISPQDWQRALPWLVVAWFGGVLVFAARLIGGWRLASRIRSAAIEPAPPEWQQALETLVRCMRTWRPVRVLISSLVEVPTVIGWFRPVILIPISAITGLPPEHIAALLAHELAHIRRHDYLANVLQTVAEALLFYHPAVWWVSSQIRVERELRCDDLAVAVCGGDVLTYARALAGIESFRPTHAGTALAANGGSLVGRIGRLIGYPSSPLESLPGPGAVSSLALVCLAGIAAVTTNDLTAKPVVPAFVSVVSPAVVQPTDRSPIAQPTARRIPHKSLPETAKPKARSAALSALLFDPIFAAPVTQPPPPAPIPPAPIIEAPEIQTLAEVPALSLPASSIPVFAASSAPPDPPDPQLPSIAMFHSGARLVEVEVVVRDKYGPVRGLSKDDFTLLDQGKPQAIAVLRASPAGGPNANALPPGTISNREDNRGQPWNGATVVLIDQLNTRFDMGGYAHLGMTRLLNGITAADTRTAVYSLGSSLHILKDFGDDPQKLMDAVAQLNQPRAGKYGPLASAFADLGDLLTLDEVEAAADARRAKTFKALQLIIQHLSRVPGRKNLVWLMDVPDIPLQVLTMAFESNVAIYPVLLRSLNFDGEQVTQYQVAVTGGRAFFDASDLAKALRTAQADADSAYVLGYYPGERALDGRFHSIAVKLAKHAVATASLEMYYRLGYLATRQTDTELVQSPLDLTGVGLTAQLQPDPQRPGLRQMRLTVDLHDLRLESNGGRMQGSFDFLLRTPGAHSFRYEAVQVGFPQARLEQALANGYAVNVNGIDAEEGDLRVAVRDRSTGAAGSLRIPIRKD